MTTTTPTLSTKENNVEIRKLMYWLVDRQPMTNEPPLTLQDIMMIEQIRLLRSIKGGISFIVIIVILSIILGFFQAVV